MIKLHLPLLAKIQALIPQTLVAVHGTTGPPPRKAAAAVLARTLSHQTAPAQLCRTKRHRTLDQRDQNRTKNIARGPFAVGGLPGCLLASLLSDENTAVR